MADLASLKISVDSRDVKTATTDLGGMASAAARSEGAIGKFGSTVRIATAAQRELNNAIKSNNQAYSTAANYVSQLADQTKRLGMSAIELKKLEIATAAAAAPTAALRNEIRAAGAEYLRAMKSAQGFNAASGGVVASAGAQRAGMQQLSFQIGDVAQQFALGTNPMVIFAQQGGQVVQALSMMRGSAGGLLGFLAGPWGAVMMGAVMILGTFFANSKKAESGTLDLADALNVQSMSARDLVNAINQLNVAQGKANRTSYEAEVQARANAVAILNQAIANRELARTELQVAEARFYNQSANSKAGLELKASYGFQAAAARRMYDDLEKGAKNAQQLLRQADVPLIRREAAAATDASAAATLRYDKAERALRLNFTSGKITRDQYLQQLTALNSTKETEIELAQKLERQGRRKPQISEYERQQKALREMITDMERELELVRAGTAADEARLRVQLTRQGANADQIAKIVQLTKDLAAEELKREEAKKRETFTNQVADLQTELGLIREGLSLEEARLRVQLARQGAIKSEIDSIIQLNGEIDGIKKSAEATKKALEDWDKLTLDVDFDSLFGSFGKALGGIVSGLDNVLERQKKYQEAVKAAGGDSTKLAKIETKNKRLMINDYANLLGSAKGFFKEGSSGYKALQAAETAYRAISIALALKEMAIKITGYGASAAAATAGAGVEVAAATAVGTANAAAAVANQGKGDPFTAWARIAAMAALMAGLGFAVLGGGKSTPPTTNTGTGTVFGDNEAQSKSIGSSIERLVDINASTMRYSSQMLNSLKNIEAAMVGVTNIVLRSTGITELSAGVQQGNSANFGQRVGGTAAMAGAGALIGAAVAGPVGAIVGSVLGGAMSLVKGLVSSLFGTKTSVVGNGITATAQSVADILATGFDALYYTEIQKKKKFFGITTSTSYQTQTTAADAEINRQFGLIIENIYTAVLATAGPLKLATDQVAQNMQNFVIDIGKIDVKGLTGEQIQEKLTAVFGAAADNIAKAAVPGLEEFQKVGEGYFETLTRVASSIETLDRTFQMLGQTTQGLTIQSQMALIETFGDATTMMEQVNEYFTAFYSETEQVAAISKQLGDALGLMGLELPDTLAGFRALVEAQDLNTDAGRRTYAQLIQLSTAFADYIDRQNELNSAIQTTNSLLDENIYAHNELSAAIAEETQRSLELARQRRALEIRLLEAQGNATAVLAARREDELAATDELLQPLLNLIYAQEDANAAAEAAARAEEERKRAIEEATRAVKEAESALRQAYEREAKVFEDTISKFSDLGKKLREFAATLLPLTGNGSASLAQLNQTFAETVALARLGNADAMSQIPEIGGKLRDAIMAGATDRISMLRQLAAVKVETESVAVVADRQVSIAQQQLDALNAQVSQFITLNENVLSVKDAIVALQSAQANLASAISSAAASQSAANAAAKTTTATKGAGGLSPAQQLYMDTLLTMQGQGTPSEIKSYVAGLSDYQSLASLAAVTGQYDAAKYSGMTGYETAADLSQKFGVPVGTYASGGFHSGGLRVVGENGPELEATGPSRIYNANQLSEMMGGGATADEVKALRDELKYAMFQIAKNTGKSYDLMNRWDGDGLPPERIVA